MKGVCHVSLVLKRSALMNGNGHASLSSADGRLTYDLQVGSNRVGRAKAACEIVLRSSRSISSKHADLQVSLDETGNLVVSLADLESTNGTFVNGTHLTGRRQRPVRLQDGDVLRFGYDERSFVVHIRPSYALEDNDDDEDDDQDAHNENDNGNDYETSQDLGAASLKEEEPPRLLSPIAHLGQSGSNAADNDDDPLGATTVGPPSRQSAATDVGPPPQPKLNFEPLSKSSLSTSSREDVDRLRSDLDLANKRIVAYEAQVAQLLTQHTAGQRVANESLQTALDAALARADAAERRLSRHLDEDPSASLKGEIHTLRTQLEEAKCRAVVAEEEAARAMTSFEALQKEIKSKGPITSAEDGPFRARGSSDAGKAQTMGATASLSQDEATQDANLQSYDTAPDVCHEAGHVDQMGNENHARHLVLVAAWFGGVRSVLVQRPGKVVLANAFAKWQHSTRLASFRRKRATRSLRHLQHEHLRLVFTVSMRRMLWRMKVFVLKMGWRALYEHYIGDRELAQARLRVSGKVRELAERSNRLLADQGELTLDFDAEGEHGGGDEAFAFTKDDDFDVPVGDESLPMDEVSPASPSADRSPLRAAVTSPLNSGATRMSRKGRRGKRKKSRRASSSVANGDENQENTSMNQARSGTNAHEQQQDNRKEVLRFGDPCAALRETSGAESPETTLEEQQQMLIEALLGQVQTLAKSEEHKRKLLAKIVVPASEGEAKSAKQSRGLVIKHLQEIDALRGELDAVRRVSTEQERAAAKNLRAVCRERDDLEHELKQEHELLVQKFEEASQQTKLREAVRTLRAQLEDLRARNGLGEHVRRATALFPLSHRARSLTVEEALGHLLAIGEPSA
ncbi:Centrosomal protein of 170 kDa protein B [Hondaea fermentalgiana]|uniref:Centrosomal protein of 170 kDa protein B n=1 Tax=Hondaea fermentalgiana TaxID=2315210 RepID=A0A2R5GS84_9STRA|nr:Centrosomal protein of 170 kDa protein B [Hondaea fermentalgiana]|eukprot:GBG33710.1 Centrosomal protein of 170 kDa protein B [Hondaea fermentalgiana]